MWASVPHKFFVRCYPSTASIQTPGTDSNWAFGYFSIRTLAAFAHVDPSGISRSLQTLLGQMSSDNSRVLAAFQMVLLILQTWFFLKMGTSISSSVFASSVLMSRRFPFYDWGALAGVLWKYYEVCADCPLVSVIPITSKHCSPLLRFAFKAGGQFAIRHKSD